MIEPDERITEQNGIWYKLVRIGGDMDITLTKKAHELYTTGAIVLDSFGQEWRVEKLHSWMGEGAKDRVFTQIKVNAVDASGLYARRNSAIFNLDMVALSTPQLKDELQSRHSLLREFQQKFIELRKEANLLIFDAQTMELGGGQGDT